jgi:plasmid maintenance system antidote protein VapI
MEPIKQNIAAQKLKISEGHLSHILAGNRNCGPRLAKQLSEMTRTTIETWLFNSKKNISTRQRAFDQLKGAA